MPLQPERGNHALVSSQTIPGIIPAGSGGSFVYEQEEAIMGLIGWLIVRDLSPA